MSTMNRDEVRTFVKEVAASLPGVAVVDRIGDGVKRVTIGEATDSGKATPSCLVTITAGETTDEEFQSALRAALQEAGKGDLVARIVAA